MSLTDRIDSVCFTTKGQVVIPVWLRRHFQIEEGTRCIVSATGEGILLRPVTAESIRRGRGLLKKRPSDAAQQNPEESHGR